MATPSVFHALPHVRIRPRRKLGSRHLQILELILEGCSNQQISAATECRLARSRTRVSHFAGARC